MKLGVVSAEGKELLVGTLLDDTPTIDDADHVGVDDRGEAVGDDDGRTARHEVIQGVLHETFTLRVQGGGSFVEDEYRRVLEDCTGDR